MFGIYSGARGGLVIYIGDSNTMGVFFFFFLEMEGKGIDWYVR